MLLPTFADPKTDFVFKRIFGAEAHKDLLIALLNHLLELEGESRIFEVQHLFREQQVAVPELKLSIVDVKCTDASGRRFVVKMQVLNAEGFERRVVYNASTPYVRQLRNADECSSLCDVVGVTISLDVFHACNPDSSHFIFVAWPSPLTPSLSLTLPASRYRPGSRWPTRSSLPVPRMRRPT